MAGTTADAQSGERHLTQSGYQRSGTYPDFRRVAALVSSAGASDASAAIKAVMSRWTEAKRGPGSMRASSM
jgi:hypothetical protein